MTAVPDFSVVVPVFDEGEAAPKLAREIAQAFAGENYEMIFVDDASRDDTKARLIALKAEIPQLRVLGHRKNSGQSRAVRSGILAARGPIIMRNIAQPIASPRRICASAMAHSSATTVVMERSPGDAARSGS